MAAARNSLELSGFILYFDTQEIMKHVKLILSQINQIQSYFNPINQLVERKFILAYAYQEK